MADKVKSRLDLNLESYELDARDCVGCSGCRWVDFIYIPGHDFAWRCPPWQKLGFDAYGACGKLKVISDVLGGGTDYDSDTLQKVAYSCMICGACDVGCKRNLDLEPQAALEALRARMVEKGKGPLPQHVPISDNIVNANNRFGLPQSKRLEWLPADAKPAEKAELLYFAGCRAAFSHRGIARSVVRTLKAAGLEFMLLRDEPCCGNYLFTTGQVEKARALAQRNIEMIKASGAKKVVFGCAEGYKTFKVDYPKLLGISTADLPFQALHFVEVAGQALKEGKLKLTLPRSMTITYHDSCNLGRLSEPWVHWEGERLDWGVLSPPRKTRRGTHGVYEPPRDLLKAIPGLRLVEMPRHHENAWCCGNAAGVKEAFPGIASWAAEERLREAESVGAEAIVAACPGCLESFTEASKARGGAIKVFDIADLVAAAAGSPG